MKKNLKLFKRITCVLGITFLLMGMVPFAKVEQAAPEFSISGIKTVLNQSTGCGKSSQCAANEYCDKSGQGQGQCTVLQCTTEQQIIDHECVDIAGDDDDSDDDDTCTLNGDSCADDYECCSGNCNGNKCKEVQAQCKPEGGPCGGNTDCCEGLVCLAGTNHEADKCGYATGDDDDEEPVCGNGIVEAGEECDDGNVLDGDECSSTCLVPLQGDDDDDDDDDPGGGGGGTSLVIIPVTGVDYTVSFFGLQKLFTFMGLMMFGVTMMLEGVERKFYK